MASPWKCSERSDKPQNTDDDKEKFYGLQSFGRDSNTHSSTDIICAIAEGQCVNTGISIVVGVSAIIASGYCESLDIVMGVSDANCHSIVRCVGNPNTICSVSILLEPRSAVLGDKGIHCNHAGKR